MIGRIRAFCAGCSRRRVLGAVHREDWLRAWTLMRRHVARFPLTDHDATLLVLCGLAVERGAYVDGFLAFLDQERPDLANRLRRGLASGFDASARSTARPI